MDHLMAEKNENNKDSQKGQVTPKKIKKKKKNLVSKLYFKYEPLLQVAY